MIVRGEEPRKLFKELELKGENWSRDPFDLSATFATVALFPSKDRGVT
jgi:hypothetical protein